MRVDCAEFGARGLLFGAIRWGRARSGTCVLLTARFDEPKRVERHREFNERRESIHRNHGDVLRIGRHIGSAPPIQVAMITLAIAEAHVIHAGRRRSREGHRARSRRPGHARNAIVNATLGRRTDSNHDLVDAARAGRHLRNRVIDINGNRLPRRSSDIRVAARTRQTIEPNVMNLDRHGHGIFHREIRLLEPALPLGSIACVKLHLGPIIGARTGHVHTHGRRQNAA